MITDRILAASIMTLALGFATAAADAAELFTLKSTTFADGKIMPKKVANSTANMPNNPNCVGANVSPQLSWSNVPDGTKSFVLLMIDPGGRRRRRQSLGRLRHPGIGHRLCRRRGKQTDRQICRRQKHPRGRVLFRTVHATQSNGPSLYVRADRNRSGADRISTRIDERGSDGEAGSSWATAGPHQRSRRHGRTLRQSMA
jgi:hypothetical protein